MTESDANNLSRDTRIQAFMNLYVGKEQCIQSYIYTLVQNWADSEDILQETAKVLWAKFEEFEPDTDFLAWALTIAHYQVLKFRKSQNKPMLFSSRLIEDLAGKAADYAHGTSRRQDALRQCMKKLTERDRQMLELRYRDGTTVERVAQHVGRNVKTVYKYLDRIRWQLLRCIQRTLAWEDQL